MLWQQLLKCGLQALVVVSHAPQPSPHDSCVANCNVLAFLTMRWFLPKNSKHSGFRMHPRHFRIMEGDLAAHEFLPRAQQVCACAHM